MIVPRIAQTVEAVAAHYNELDAFYRDVWGEHVHHGYWATGREADDDAADALVDLLAERLGLVPGEDVCDIGCGYGAAARRLAERNGVNITGVTISAAQARVAADRLLAQPPPRGKVSVALQDWLTNSFETKSFARAYAIESSEHMVDKQRFFDEASRVLRPDGTLGVFAWLACDAPRPWEIRHLLEPICREGRLPSMGDEGDYRHWAELAGLRTISVEDLSAQVRRTWSICAWRLVGRLLTRPQYVRFLLSRSSSNRVFLVTVLRLLAAYRTGSMRYCLMVFRREPQTEGFESAPMRAEPAGE
jgi:tocopherol O-methyltransferase